MLGRKELKMLELEAARFGFESIDVGGYRAAVLQTADRLGLLFAGDVSVALRIVHAAEIAPAAEAAVLDHEALAASPRALDVIRFALSEDYLALRLDAGAGEL
jgi:hypothetical protein